MIVLDTQCWLWWLHEPLKLSTMARKAIEEAEKPSGIMVDRFKKQNRQTRATFRDPRVVP